MSVSSSLPQSDADVLAAMQQSAYEELQFFSNKGKADRERWVVSQFLERSQIAFVASELVSPHQRSETDVHFRNANFQVKEILNPGSKRGEEIKSTYNRLKNATKIEDVIGPPFVYDVPPPCTIYSLVSEEATKLAYDRKYHKTKSKLDLLFYVTRTRASPIREEEIDLEQLAKLGWRSISCLAGAHANVLFAQLHAPEFLRT